MTDGRYPAPFSPPWNLPRWVIKAGGQFEVSEQVRADIADESSDLEAEHFCVFIKGNLGICGAYEEALVRAHGKKKQRSTWTVADVLESMVQAVIATHNESLDVSLIVCS